MLRNLFTLLFVCTALAAAAQPKWFKRVRKAQMNIITYDADGQLLRSTNGFFIDNDGTLLCDYAAFRGAARAVAVDERGKEYPVETIAGASALYDVIKLHIGGVKPTPLTLAHTIAAKGDAAHIMPYLSSKTGVCTTTTVADASIFNETYAYYTLPVQLTEKSTSCPVLNDDGEVIGMVQMSAKADDDKCFAISADFVRSLTVSALSATATDYHDLLLRKQLPDDEAQAASFIFLIGMRDTALYLNYTDDFIRRFPSSTQGYVLRAEMLTAKGDFSQADETWEAAIKAKTTAHEVLYSRARSIFGAIDTGHALPDTWTLDRALEDIREALAAEPLPIYAALEAHILYAQKHYAEAAARFLSANQGKMHSADNFLYAAQCQQMLGDTAAVLALQDSAVACFTKPYVEAAAPALLMRAQTLLTLGRYRLAVADLNDYEHLKARLVNANFYYQRYQAEMRCRMFQQALSDIQRASSMEPSEPLYHAELAATHFRFNQLDEAIAAARTAIALDDTFADAHRILGVCLRQQKKEQEAQQQLRRAAELGDEMAQKLLTP